MAPSANERSMIPLVLGGAAGTIIFAIQLRLLHKTLHEHGALLKKLSKKATRHGGSTRLEDSAREEESAEEDRDPVDTPSLPAFMSWMSCLILSMHSLLVPWKMLSTLSD